MKMPERLAEYLQELSDDLHASDPDAGITPDDEAGDEVRRLADLYSNGWTLPRWIPVEERLPTADDADEGS